MIIKVKDLMKLRKFSLLCLFMSIPISLFGGILLIRFLIYIGICLLIAFIVISLIFWRCPHCKERLPIRFNINTDIDDSYWCPYCDEKF